MSAGRRLRQLLIQLNPFKPLSGGSDACWPEAYAEFMAAKREWLSKIEEVAVRARPDLSVEIRAKLRLQHLYDQRSLQRLAHLLTYEPQRVDLSGGLSRVYASVEAAWSEADFARLSAADSEYARIEEEIALLRAVPKLPDDAFAALEKSPEYRRAAKRLRECARQMKGTLPTN